MLRRTLSSAFVGVAAVAALAAGGGAANAAPTPDAAPTPNAAAAAHCGWYTQANWLGTVFSRYNHCAGHRQLIRVNYADNSHDFRCAAPWSDQSLGPFSVVRYAYAVPGPC